MNAKELIREAVSLPVEERALVVDSLLRSINQPESAIDKKWAEAARRRLAELRSGSVEAIPGQKFSIRFGKDLINELLVSPRSRGGVQWRH